VLLLALWWVWTFTVWLANRMDPRRLTVEAVVLTTMIGSIAMAAVLTDAFAKRGVVFASVCAGLHVFMPIFFIVALSQPEKLLGRVTAPSWPVAADHLAERHRQLFIIALGELIIVTGLTFTRTDFTADRTGAFATAIFTTTLFWRIYVYRAGELLEEAIAAAPDPVRLTRPMALAHLAMVAGVVVTAVGDELVLTQPFGHSHPAWVAVLLGGPALFVAGRVRLEQTVFGRVSPDRPIALLTLAGLSVPLLFAPPLLAVIAVAAVLTAIVLFDARRAQRYPTEPVPRNGPS
jgi:low temperature requirement protein LtrA